MVSLYQPETLYLSPFDWYGNEAFHARPYENVYYYEDNDESSEEEIACSRRKFSLVSEANLVPDVGDDGRRDPVLHLPVEIIFLIFTFLSVKELGLAATLSSAWKKFAEEEASWAFHYRQQWGKPSPLSLMMFRNATWKHSFLLREKVEREFHKSLGEKGTNISNLNDINLTIFRTYFLEALIQKKKCDQYIGFLYGDYEFLMNSQASVDLPWIHRNFTATITTHAQDLRRQRKYASASLLIEKALAYCRKEVLKEKAEVEKYEKAREAERISFLHAGNPPTMPERKVQYNGYGGTFALALLNQAQIFLVKKRKEKAEEVFKETEEVLLAMSENYPYRALNLACLYSLLNRFEDCQKWLETAFTQGNMTFAWLEDEADLWPVHQCEWYLDLEQRVKARDRQRAKKQQEQQKSAGSGNCCLS